VRSAISLSRLAGLSISERSLIITIMENGDRRSRRGRPPKAEGRQTRAWILEAALDGFATHGYAGTSIRQIARAVGITESAIYSHFENKQAIFRALITETGPAAVLDALEPAVNLEASPATAIRRLAGLVIDAWDRPLARKVMSVLLREGGPASTIGGINLSSEVARVQERLQAVFQAWMDAGLVRDDFPAEHLAWELMAPIGMIRVFYLQADASRDRRAKGRELASRHVDYYLACTLKKEIAR
jgi:AcrR family transcriptional regulator